MTYEQFKSLKPGDPVILDFSLDTNQIVIKIDLEKGTISSRPENEELVEYTNKFDYIGYVAPKKAKPESKEKKQILAWFEEFLKKDCENCPFNEECSNVYDETRAHSTTTMNICQALVKKTVDF